MKKKPELFCPFCKETLNPREYEHNITAGEFIFIRCPTCGEEFYLWEHRFWNLFSERII